MEYCFWLWLWIQILIGRYNNFWELDLPSTNRKWLKGLFCYLRSINRFFLLYENWIGFLLSYYVLCRYGVFWCAETIMLQCIEGFKHLFASLLQLCDTNPSRGLEDPEILARETVCMASTYCFFMRIWVYLFTASRPAVYTITCPGISLHELSCVFINDY